MTGMMVIFDYDRLGQGQSVVLIRNLRLLERLLKIENIDPGSEIERKRHRPHSFSVIIVLFLFIFLLLGFLFESSRLVVCFVLDLNKPVSLFYFYTLMRPSCV